jgi:hypothetical protein
MRDSLRAPTNVSDNDSLLLSNTYNIVSSEEPFKPTRVPPLTAPARGLRRATAACRGLAAVAGTAIRDFRRNKANQQCQVWVGPAIVKKMARDGAPEYHQFRFYMVYRLYIGASWVGTLGDTVRTSRHKLIFGPRAVLRGSHARGIFA